MLQVPRECDELAVLESIMEERNDSLLPEVDVKAYIALASTLTAQVHISIVLLNSNFTALCLNDRNTFF